jgi:hypothetical protein
VRHLLPHLLGLGGKGLGIQRHLEDCLAVAQRLGWTVVDHYIDNDTGASRYSKKKAGGSQIFKSSASSMTWRSRR